MVKKSIILRLALCALPFMGGAAALAEAPAGYYSTCEGKNGSDLLKALNKRISSHTNVGYDGLWNVYKTSDVRPNGKVWDMYSTKEWNVGAQHCGNYKNIGDCINREHSVPQSWFSKASPMKSDAFHVYPTDGKVNGQRSNFPYGECEGGTVLPSNGSVKALGRLGTSTYPGYSGKVFEPDDEYKGDFARTYFYMAACYNDRISSWSGEALAGNDYPVFKTWTVNLLLKWHRQDPVSDKERTRNDAVYAHQKNRNPFIDYPELAEHIWGDDKNIGWTPGGEVRPSIATPVNGTTIDMGLAGVNVARTAVITVKGQNLKENVSVSVSGAGFSASSSSLQASSVNSTAGASLTLRYLSASAAESTGTLTLASGTAKSVITLKAKAVDGIPALPATEVGEETFTARWVCVDDAAATYELHVLTGGQEIAGYPKSVVASAEEYNVEGLTPGTTYVYYLNSLTMGESNRVEVTTSVPIPSIQFLFDGDLFFTTAPGEPSEAAEILVDVENIADDLSISVMEPFELSLDKNRWTRTVTLVPGEERFYLRVYSETIGDFTTTLAATAGDYESEDVTVSATVASDPTFIETFEPASTLTSYDGGEYVGSAAQWQITGALIGNDSRDRHSGKQGVRLHKKAEEASAITMIEGKPHGMGTVSFYAKAWNGEGGDVDLDYSNDGGITWHPVKTFTVTDDAWKQYSANVNAMGETRMRLVRKSGKRIAIDDIEASDYAVTAVNELDYHRWDAFCRDGELIVENLSADQLEVVVTAINGVEWHRSTLGRGELTLDLYPGLYLVSIDGFTRRVVVK